MRNFEHADAISQSSNRWSSSGSVSEGDSSRDKQATRRHSITMEAFPCRIPRQCFQRNSQELERETPLRAPSQTSRRQSDRQRDITSLEHSLQAMADFVRTLEGKAGNTEYLRPQPRHSLPPRLPHRKASLRGSHRCLNI